MGNKKKEAPFGAYISYRDAVTQAKEEITSPSAYFRPDTHKGESDAIPESVIIDLFILFDGHILIGHVGACDRIPGNIRFTHLKGHLAVNAEKQETFTGNQTDINR